MTDSDKRKIFDRDLDDFAANGETDELRSVIVELDTPPRSASKNEWQATPWQKGTYPGLSESAAAAAGDEELEDKLMNRLETKLLSLKLSEKPVRLDVAQAFVVNVNPAQLRSILQFSLTGLIRPNQTRLIPRAVKIA